MLVKVAGEVDLATRDELQHMHSSILKGTSSAKSNWLPLTATQVGSGYLSLGSPPAGRLWDLQLVTLFGSNDNTTVPGTAAVYIGDPVNPGLNQMFICGLQIPTSLQISGDTLRCYSSQAVVINFVGVSSTQQVGCNCSVLEYRVADKSLGTGA